MNGPHLFHGASSCLLSASWGTATAGSALIRCKVKDPDMNKEPKPTRGMPRSLLYAMIPGGFLVIILILFLTGFWRQEATDEMPPVVEEPAPAVVE